MSDVPDMQSLLNQAMQMQQQLLAAQAEAAARVVEGVAGGGMVRVEVTGAMEFRRVTIDPRVVDPGDVAMLEDLVLAAVHDATAKVAAVSQEAMGGLGLPGGGLGGLLG